jgi:hypothetical protein
VALFAAAIVFFTVQVVLSYGHVQDKKFLLKSYLIAVSFTGLVVALVSIPHLDRHVLRFFVSIFGLHLTQLLAAALVIVLGWLAHRFKSWNKPWYGYVEVAVAAVSAIAVVSRLNLAAIDVGSLTLAQYATLVGAAYVVARGLNNITEAKAQNGTGISDDVRTSR